MDAKLLKDCYNFMIRGWRVSLTGNYYASGLRAEKEAIKARPLGGRLARDSIFWIFSFNFM